MLSPEEIDALPAYTRNCGIFLEQNSKDIRKAKRELQADEERYEMPFPPSLYGEEV